MVSEKTIVKGLEFAHACVLEVQVAATDPGTSHEQYLAICGNANHVLDVLESMVFEYIGITRIESQAPANALDTDGFLVQPTAYQATVAWCAERRRWVSCDGSQKEMPDA
jgi:hypothetical protein